MLEFIDPFADQGHRFDKRLKVISIWIGSVPDKKSLKKYLSVEAPENGRFVRDMGVEWFDHDFIAGEYQRQPEAIENVVDHLGQILGCPDDMKQEIVRRCRKRGLAQANATVCLLQHVFKGDEERDFNGLVFVGNFEYEEPAPSLW